MRNKQFILLSLVMLCLNTLLVSCSKDDDNNVVPDEGKFESLESPYLICAGRNPGGVGFDFEYQSKKGGANNLDSLSVEDFKYDVKIRVVKGEKPDGSLGGAPYIQLFEEDVQAVNYSAIDNSCKGIQKFKELKLSDIKEYTLKADDQSFDVSSVEKGKTGKPLMKKLLAEYKKLVIGQEWKASANNDEEGDELIWIIKTREGKLVKFIVTDFPAAPAPTPKGYVAVDWDILEE